MPNFTTGFPRMTGDTEGDVRKLGDWAIALVDELKWLFNNLDSGNVIEAAKVKDKVVKAETVIAETVITDTLYAEYGEIADLTVNKISTSHRIYKYLTGDLTDDYYFEGYGNGIYWCQGRVRFADSVPVTEQIRNHEGKPLYWQRPIAYTSGGQVFDEEGVRIGLTTKNTSVPCIVYAYDVLVKASFTNTPDENNNMTPMLIMGAGDGNGNSRKCAVYKDTDGLKILYFRGEHISSIEMGDEGVYLDYVDNEGISTGFNIDEAGASLFGNWDLGEYILPACELTSLAYVCYVTGLTLYGQTKKIVRVSKYGYTNDGKMCINSGVNFAYSGNTEVISEALEKIIIPNFDDYSSYDIILGNCPNLKEVVIDCNRFHNGAAFENCPNVRIVRFTGINKSEYKQLSPIGYMMQNSYVEEVYLNDEFMSDTGNGSMGLFCGALSEKVTIHANSDMILRSGAVNGCENLKEIIFDAPITEMQAGALHTLPSLERVTIPSMECVIAEEAFGDITTVTVVCYENSDVHSWAVGKGFDVELIGE